MCKFSDSFSFRANSIVLNKRILKYDEKICVFILNFLLIAIIGTLFSDKHKIRDNVFLFSLCLTFIFHIFGLD